MKCCCCRQRATAVLASSSDADWPTDQDALAYAFPFYFTLLRLVFRYRLEDSTPAWRSPLVVFLSIACGACTVFGLANWFVYRNGSAVQIAAAGWTRDNGFILLIAPAMGIYIVGYLLPKIRQLQPVIRSYNRYPNVHRCHQRVMILGVALPIIGFIVAICGYTFASYAKERHIYYPTPCFINTVVLVIMMSIVLGACAPLAWSVYLFTVLVDMQAINVFRHLLARRDPAMADELKKETAFADRLLLAEAPQTPKISSRSRAGSTTATGSTLSATPRQAPGVATLLTVSGDETHDAPGVAASARFVISNPVHSAGSPDEQRRSFAPEQRRAGANSSDGTGSNADGTRQPVPALLLPVAVGPPLLSPAAVSAAAGKLARSPDSRGDSEWEEQQAKGAKALTVDDVLRVQRALQKTVLGHSMVWLVPTGAGLIAAALITLVAALNILNNVRSPDGAKFIWMILGPLCVLLMLTPGVTLNSTWTDILRSPDMDWSEWHAAERAWLTSRFTLSPVVFPVVGIAFDWLSLVKLLVTSLAPLAVTQVMKLQDVIEDAVIQGQNATGTT